MKKNLIYLLTFLLLGFLPALTVYAQAPDKFYFQAEARDSKGKPIEKATDLSVKITILAGSPGGTVVWEGYHYDVHTDDYGLFTLVIGEGTDGSHNFWAIDWANNSHYLNVQVEDNGTWVDMGTTQFLSVPYAKHATKADSVIYEVDPQVGSNTKDYIPVWNDSALVSGIIYNKDTMVRMGTTSENAFLDVHGDIHSSQGLTVGSTTRYRDGSITLSPGTNLNIDHGTLFIDNENNRVGIGTTSPSKGLEVDDTVKAHFFIGDGSGLDMIWNLFGNAGTDPAHHFLGTNDDNPIVFRVNRNERMRLNSNGNLSFIGTGESVFIGEGAGVNDDLTNNGNVFIGFEAGNSNTAGYGNTATGRRALYSNNGDGNSAYGSYALFSNEGGDTNTAFGYTALFSNINGFGNTAMGVGTLGANIDGNLNTASGYSALVSNMSGNYNTAMGVEALGANIDGSYNTASGYRALSKNRTGSYNTAMGVGALWASTGGSNNTAAGWRALYYNQADTNTAFGSHALYNNTTGSGNTACGTGALYSNLDGYSNTAMGCYTLGSNKTGYYNTATGQYALGSNTAGNYNTAMGEGALSANTGGSSNTAIGWRALFYNQADTNTAYGFRALYNNTWGSGNTAIGIGSLHKNIEGDQNTAIGNHALSANENGDYNTAVGAHSGPTMDTLYNTGAFGYGAKVTASNNYVFGNQNVVGWGFGVSPDFAAIRVGTTSSNGNGATLTLGGVWTDASDISKKFDIEDINYGLADVMRLHPVTYKLKGLNIQDIGFIAQEVKEILPEIVYGEEGQMTMSYGQVTSVLVKAIQEQQQMIEELQQEIERLKK